MKIKGWIVNKWWVVGIVSYGFFGATAALILNKPQEFLYFATVTLIPIALCVWGKPVMNGKVQKGK